MEGTDVAGAITEVSDGDTLLATDLRGERQTVGDGQGAADNTGGDHHAGGRMGHMHRPTLALAGAGDAAAELRPEILQRDALGDHVMHTTIDSANVILVGQTGRYR
ncbi:hypothetical protein D3C85_1175330 [compost metagenome]